MNHDWIAIIVLAIWVSMGLIAIALVICETIKRKEELLVKELFLGLIVGILLAPISLWFAFDTCDFKFVSFIKRKWYGFWDYKIIKNKS